MSHILFIRGIFFPMFPFFLEFPGKKKKEVTYDHNFGLQVDGMDALAVKQACKFAKEHALKNGPIVSSL